jgi:hypothetical protein
MTIGNILLDVLCVALLACTAVALVERFARKLAEIVIRGLWK